MLSVLSACGGGDDETSATTPVGGTSPSTPAPAPAVTGAAKYAGNWTFCEPSGSANSERESLAITATGENTGSFTSTEARYAGTACAGAALSSQSSTGTFTIVGTKAIASETVDKVNVVEGGRTEKQVFVVRADGRFFTGVPTDEAGSNPDSEGYPSAIDRVPFTRP